MPQREWRSELRDSATVATKAAQTEFGAMLGQVPWDWFTTHTFKAEYVSRKAGDRSWYTWFDVVRNYAGADPGAYYFRVEEYQGRGTLHYHALVGGVAGLRRLTFKDWWEMDGFARVLPYDVEKYDPGRGANYYVGKYLAKEQGDIRFSHQLDRLLKTVNSGVQPRPADRGSAAAGASLKTVSIPERGDT